MNLIFVCQNHLTPGFGDRKKNMYLSEPNQIVRHQDIVLPIYFIQSNQNLFSTKYRFAKNAKDLKFLFASCEINSHFAKMKNG